MVNGFRITIKGEGFVNASLKQGMAVAAAADSAVDQPLDHAGSAGRNASMTAGKRTGMCCFICRGFTPDEFSRA